MGGGQVAGCGGVIGHLAQPDSTLSSLDSTLPNQACSVSGTALILVDMSTSDNASRHSLRLTR
jgi:hypothetical protein